MDWDALRVRVVGLTVEQVLGKERTPGCLSPGAAWDTEVPSLKTRRLSEVVGGGCSFGHFYFKMLLEIPDVRRAAGVMEFEARLLGDITI